MLSRMRHAGARPLNSALEVDLDFERAIVPPPQPTREAMESLETLIKARIADHRFDDPPRMAAAEPEQKQRPQIELDDSKSKKASPKIQPPMHLYALHIFTASSQIPMKVLHSI